MNKTSTQTDEIIDIIVDLFDKGFDQDYIIRSGQIRCLQSGRVIATDDFDILEIHRCAVKNYQQLEYHVFGIMLIKTEVKGILMCTHKLIGGVCPNLLKKLGLETVRSSQFVD
jgi:hypothetical protein